MVYVSEITVTPRKPQGSFVGFASCVIDNKFYLGGLGIHSDRSNPGGFRIVYPSKRLANGKDLPLFHPIDKVVGQKIQTAIMEEWERIAQ